MVRLLPIPIFNKGSKDKRINLAVSEDMFQRIEYIASLFGTSKPEIVCQILDKFLFEAIQDGLIKAPDDVMIKVKELAKLVQKVS